MSYLDDRFVRVSRETRMVKQRSIRQLRECEEALTAKRRVAELIRSVIRVFTSHRGGVRRVLRCWSGISHKMRHIIMRVTSNLSIVRTGGDRPGSTWKTNRAAVILIPSARRRGLAFHVKRVNFEREHEEVLRIAAAPFRSAPTMSVPRETLTLAAGAVRAPTSCRPGPIRTSHPRTEARTSPRPLHVSGPRAPPGGQGQSTLRSVFPPPGTIETRPLTYTDPRPTHCRRTR